MPDPSSKPISIEKNTQVQSLRGLACVFLVLYHVIGNNASMGLNVPDDSFYRSFADLVLPFRMPLFSFLSGYVYALRPLFPSMEGTFAKKNYVAYSCL